MASEALSGFDTLLSGRVWCGLSYRAPDQARPTRGTLLFDGPEVNQLEALVSLQNSVAFVTKQNPILLFALRGEALPGHLPRLGIISELCLCSPWGWAVRRSHCVMEGSGGSKPCVT